MLEIINSKGLVMDFADGNIPVEKNNALFNPSGQLLMDVSYSGSAPFTPGNKLFFQFGHLVSASNQAYELEVKLLVNNNFFFAGTLSYRVLKNNFSFTLKQNFASVANKAAITDVVDIRINDALLNTLSTAAFEAYMKDTCVNPDNYPLAYFPVYNPLANRESKGYDYVNFWSVNSQKFFAQNPAAFPATRINYVLGFYYRLNYIIEKIIKYLGFKAEGSIFTDPKFKKKYIFINHPNTGNVGGNKDRVNSLFYMVRDEKVGEFLKKIRDRYHLSFSFNYETKIVKIDTFKFLLKQSKVFDISEFVEEISEIEIVNNKGYNVNLKPDADDAFFSVATDADNTQSLPTNYLKVAEADQNLELNISTLKPHVVGLSKSVKFKKEVYHDFTGNDFKLETITRVVNFNGMVNIGGTDVWPESEPDELGPDDLLYYTWSTQAKRLRVVATLPSYLLSQITENDRVAFISKEGEYGTYLIEKNAFDLNNNASRIKCEFSVIANDRVNRKASIEVPTVTAGFFLTYLLCQFNQALFNKIDIQVYAILDGVSSKIFEHSFTRSCDTFGTLGERASVNLPTDRPVRQTYELRVLTGQPRYYEQNGNKTNFTFNGTYSFAPLNGVFYLGFQIVF